MKKETVILPVHFAPYLINGDTDSYSDDEIKEIKLFISRRHFGSCLHADVENKYFKHRNDLNSLGSDVCEYVFQKFTYSKNNRLIIELKNDINQMLPIDFWISFDNVKGGNKQLRSQTLMENFPNEKGMVIYLAGYLKALQTNKIIEQLKK